MTTPTLRLQTLFVFDDRGRITSTREPGGGPGPLFAIIRSRAECAWAVRADVPEDVASGLERVARAEPPAADFRLPPVHADRYVATLTRAVRDAPLHPSSGPSFTFPEALPLAGEIVRVEDERLLAPHFEGWVVGEIAEGRAPVVAVVEDGIPVSICFCARSSEVAAEAGLETAAGFRGRGYAALVTAAWAAAIRASGRTPLYSTSWTNLASLAVARKLGLVVDASSWSLSD